jgi:transglutaminase-like putative cysteine protease
MHRFRLEHGWTTFWLVALLVFTATLSVQQAEWAEGLHILTPITIIGLFVGVLLANMRQLPPVAAHATALIIGFIVVFFQMTTFLSDALGSRWDKLGWLWGRWEEWYATIRGGESAEDLYLFILMMSGMLWVLSYASIWFVFRSGWIWITLLLPGVIVLLNLGYSRNVSTFVLILYLFSAILLLMRFHFVEREIRWRREGVPYPDTLLIRGFWTASYLAAILILTGWMIPFSPQTDRAVAAWNSATGPWDSIEEAFTDRFGGVLPGRGGGSGGVGGFASFDSEFSLGGSLRLSEDPVVFVQGQEAPYLSAHRYDYYTGTGWESTFERTYQSGNDDEDEETSSPFVRFDADQEYPIPASSRSATRERTHQVEVLRPQGNIILSGGEALRSNIDTQVQTAWYTYEDQEIALENAEEGNTPPDLWNLVALLKDADFSPPTDEQGDGESSPESTDENSETDTEGESPDNESLQIDQNNLSDEQEDLLERIRDAQDELIERDIDTELVLADDFTVEGLRFSGPLPVFNDVEAIYASDISSGDVYEVTSLTSQATAEELTSASDAYPVEITSRYLQIPDEYSERVEQLAFDLTSDLDSAYEKATAIEGWLRENLEYSEQISIPPEDIDFLEYFIFESQEGYCTYYASAMAQMLRMVDVPARVTVGYFPAAYDEDFNGAVYRDRNAHAWVEVYFPEYGWVDFEPTPSQSTIRRGSTSDEQELPDDLINDPALGGEYPPDRLEYFEEEFAPGAGGGDAAAGAQQATTTGQWIMRGIAVFLLLAVGVFSFFWLRGLSGQSPAGQFFTRLQRGASWTGVRASAAMTPFEYARSIASTVPGSRTDAEYLAEIYVRERYGNRQLAAPELTRARAAWLRLRGLFVKYALLHRWRKRGNRSES